MNAARSLPRARRRRCAGVARSPPARSRRRRRAGAPGAAGAGRRSAAARDTAVFAGEVKPRHEADLGFRIGGKIVARYVDVGARVRKGPGARAPRPGRRRPAGRGGEGAGRRGRDRVQVRARPSSSATRTCSTREVHQRVGARREAQHARTPTARSTSRRRRSSRSRATRRATRRWSPTEDGVITAVERRGRAGRDGRAARRAPRARGRARGRDRGAGEPHRRARAREGARWWCCGRTRGKIYPAQVREVAPAVDPATRTFAVRVSILDPDPARAVGHDRQRRAVARERRADAALLPLTSIYQHRTASRRCGSTTRRRGKVSAARR